MKTTPIEKYEGIFVKREDMCFEAPAPPFSKCRGIIVHLEKLKKIGIKTVGYTETSISMAGWGVAWACSLLGMKAVIFDPQYKVTPKTLAYHREQWAKFDCVTIVPLKAGMAKVNWYISKTILESNYKNSLLLPLGLPFPETIEATAVEVRRTLKFIEENNIKTVVSCVGSGTIAAGIFRGLSDYASPVKLIGVMTRTGVSSHKHDAIVHKSGILSQGLFHSDTSLQVFDPGWEYTQPSKIDCPFPCHEYYDLKAWQFIKEHQRYMDKNILFWNIGK